MYNEILKDENLDASGLIIDIVDAANGANLDDVTNYIDAYKELGVSFSLDDFASYSGSIEALGMLKANRFNVDKRFCKQIFSSKEALETMRMIRYISSTFKLDAMIKNIEDKKESAKFKAVINRNDELIRQALSNDKEYHKVEFFPNVIDF